MNHRVNVHSKWKGVRKGKGNGDARGEKKGKEQKGSTQATKRL